MNYEQEFKIFQKNINSAARAFYYYRELNSQVYQDGLHHDKLEGGCFQDSRKYQAMQANAQFWNDYDYMSIQHVFITLGRIFSAKDSRGNKSHCIDRLFDLMIDTDLFQKEELRKRKINDSDNYDEWIDDYMQTIHALNQNDFDELKKYISETKNLWNIIKKVRDKIYAHEDVLDDDAKSQIYKKAEYLKIEEIIQRLLTLEEILWQAYYNGQKPDFGYKSEKIKNRAAKEIEALLERLS